MARDRRVSSRLMMKNVIYKSISDIQRYSYIHFRPHATLIEIVLMLPFLALGVYIFFRDKRQSDKFIILSLLIAFNLFTVPLICYDIAVFDYYPPWFESVPFIVINTCLLMRRYIENRKLAYRISGFIFFVLCSYFYIMTFISGELLLLRGLVNWGSPIER